MARLKITKNNCSPSLVTNRPMPPLKPAATCSRVFTLRSTTSRSSSSGYAPNNNINGGNNLVFAQQEEVDNSSSAYNTGGSNNSASPKVVDESPPVTMDNSGEDHLVATIPVSSMLLLPFGKSGRIGLCSSNLRTAYVSGETNIKLIKDFFIPLQRILQFYSIFKLLILLVQLISMLKYLLCIFN